MQLCYVFNTKSSVLSALEFSASDKKRAVSVLERLKVNWMTVIKKIRANSQKSSLQRRLICNKNFALYLNCRLI